MVIFGLFCLICVVVFSLFIRGMEMFIRSIFGVYFWVR